MPKAEGIENAGREHFISTPIDESLLSKAKKKFRTKTAMYRAGLALAYTANKVDIISALTEVGYDEAAIKNILKKK